MSASGRMPSILNSYEQLALLKQPNPRVPTGIRNLCMIRLMLNIGLRVNEIINLKNEDLNWDEGTVHIEASGAASERTLWLEEAELSMLRRWAHVKPKNSKHVFTTLSGGQLKDRYIREMVKRLARKAGITKDVYPHLLRKTFAVEFIRKTGDINLLQEALGHRDLTSTQAYTKHIFNKKEEYDYTDNSRKFGGMPVFTARPQRLPATQRAINYSGSLRYSGSSHSEEFDRATGRPASSKTGGPETVKSAGLNKYKDKARAEEIQADHNTGINKGEDKAQEKDLDMPGEPQITLDNDDNEDKLIRIPAIKCSNCSYILRYKINCPYCGTKFNEIIEHWRSNI